MSEPTTLRRCLRPAALALPLALSFASATLAEDFVPEVVTTKPAIDPGANVFVSEQQWIGAGSIAVFNQETLKLQEQLPVGAMGLMAITPDGKTAYAVSSYMKRITYGANEMALTSYDVTTGVIGPEVILPPKAAMALGYAMLLRFSPDQKFMLVQNATPASSVTVVDLASGAVTQELPTPGCWGIYPALSGSKFSTICGDGTFASYTLSEDGASAEKTVSAPVFDADADPIFVQDARLGDTLYFATYKGKLIGLSDAGDVIEKVSETDIVAGVEGNWAPGGYGMMAAAAGKGALFISMHPDAKDGSQKTASKEIWAVDPVAGKVLARSEAEGMGSFTVTPGAEPLLFGTSEEGKLLKFTVGEDYALTKAGEVDVVGFAMHVAVTE